MKHFKILTIILLGTYFILSCSSDHDHSDNGHNHVHETSGSHTHEAESAAHSHDESTHHVHEEDEPHVHGEDDGQHVHEEGDHTHVHEHANDEATATNVVEHDGHNHTHDASDAIQIDQAWEKLIDLKTDVARIKPIEYVINVPGKIVPDANKIAVVSPIIDASVNCVFKNIGDRVQSGDLLVCLSSPEIGILRAEYDKAKAELEIEKQTFERKQKLYNEQIIPDKSFQTAELALKVAEVNLNYATKKLLASGISMDELDQPKHKHTEATGSTIHLTAPISGVITQRKASIGEKVDQSSQLFEIVDLKTVWLEADVFEKDLTKIKSGQKVNLRVSAYPDEFFTGAIFFIGSTLKPETKTIQILVEVKNPNEKLKPGMFASTSVILGEKSNSLVIPKTAILEDENLQIVFVKEAEGYHRHIIKTGVVSDSYVEILSGIEAGAIVVTSGNYQLKSKLKMSTVDPHAGHVH